MNDALRVKFPVDADHRDRSAARGPYTRRSLCRPRLLRFPFALRFARLLLLPRLSKMPKTGSLLTPFLDPGSVVPQRVGSRAGR
jgi:hypothetical protein